MAFTTLYWLVRGYGDVFYDTESVFKVDFPPDRGEFIKDFKNSYGIAW